MLKLGFHVDWMTLVMRCVASVSYIVEINGCKSNSFIPSRGLRQRDLLGPYLFLICAEGLSTSLRVAQEEKRVQGVQIGREGLMINHLFFCLR